MSSLYKYAALAILLVFASAMPNLALAQKQVIPIPAFGINGAQLQQAVPHTLKGYTNHEEWQYYEAETELFDYPVKIQYSLYYDSLVEIGWSWKIPAPSAAERQRLLDNAGLLASGTLSNPESKLWQRAFDTSQVVAGSKPLSWMCLNYWEEAGSKNNGFVTGFVNTDDDTLHLTANLIKGDTPLSGLYTFLKGTPDDSWMAGRAHENYPKTFMLAPWGASPQTIMDLEGGAPEAMLSHMLPKFSMLTFKRIGFGGWPVTVYYSFEHDRLSFTTYEIQAKGLTMRDCFELTFAVENALLADIPVKGFYFKSSRRRHIDESNYWRPYFSLIADEDNYITLLSSIRPNGTMFMFNIDMRDRRNPQEAEWIEHWEESWNPAKAVKNEAE